MSLEDSPTLRVIQPSATHSDPQTSFLLDRLPVLRTRVGQNILVDMERVGLVPRISIEYLLKANLCGQIETRSAGLPIGST